MIGSTEETTKALELANEIAIRRLEFTENMSKTPTHVRIPRSLQDTLFHLPMWSELATGVVFRKDMYIHGMDIIWDDELSHIEVFRDVPLKEHIATVTQEVIKETIDHYTSADPDFSLQEIAIPVEIEEKLCHLPRTIIGTSIYTKLSKGGSLRKMMPTFYGYNLMWGSENLELKGSSGTGEKEIVISVSVDRIHQLIEDKLEKTVEVL